MERSRSVTVMPTFTTAPTRGFCVVIVTCGALAPSARGTRLWKTPRKPMPPTTAARVNATSRSCILNMDLTPFRFKTGRGQLVFETSTRTMAGHASAVIVLTTERLGLTAYEPRQFNRRQHPPHRGREIDPQM